MRLSSSLRPRAFMGALTFFVLLLALYSSFTQGYGPGSNYRNYSVETRVNITNAGPEVLSIFLGSSVTLTAGGTKIVFCNVSVRDFNSASDLDHLNATLFHSSSSLSAADNNNTHYSNASCDVNVQDGIYANYSCLFEVYYYANNGTWNCSVAVNDSRDYQTRATNTTQFNALYALNVSALIDFGNLSIGDISENKSADITNFGNIPINVSVYGYGGRAGDGLSFQCDFGNISVGMTKFSSDIAAGFATKTNLSSLPQNLTGLTMLKQTVPETLITNTTYWQIYVPPNPFGMCNGTVVFQAEAA